MRNNIKKFISFFLVLAILTTLSVGAFAATASKSKAPADRECENMLGLMKKLGIVMDYDALSETKSITRGYFATIAARLFNMPFDGAAKEQRFTDVPTYSTYADAIEVLVERGLINGDGSGAFRPNDKIKTIEALKILVMIADYSFIADNNGGYPDGVIKAANTAGLLDGIGNVYDYVSYESLLVMLSNLLNANTVEKKQMADGYKYEISTDEILLNTMFCVDMMEGVLTKNSYTAFFSASDLAENHVEITSDGQKHVFYSKDAGEFIGKNVKVFYSEEYTENGYEDVILFAYPKTRNILTLDIADINLSQSTIDEINYYVDGNKKLKKASCVESPTVIYNKMAYAEGSFNFENVLSEMKGTVELIDNSGDGTYEIINITAYKSFIIGNILLEDQKVFSRWDAYGKNTDPSNADVININPEDYESFSMTFADGAKAEAINIVERQVISVAQSSPSAAKQVIDIKLSKNVQSGKITEIDYGVNSGSKCTITIDDQRKFNVTETVINNFELQLNKNYSFYVDAFGNIVGVGQIAAGYYRYGIFLDCAKDRHKISAKFFSAENSIQETTFAERVYIDGVKYTNINDAWTRLQEVIEEQYKPFDGISDYQLRKGVFVMRYMLNEDGQITKLDTPTDKASSEDDGLVLYDSGLFYHFYDYILLEREVGTTVPITKDATVIWMTLSDYATSEYDESALDVVSASSMVSSFDYENTVIYKVKNNLDENYPYADFILTLSGVGINQDTDLFVVDSVGGAVDPNTGDMLKCINGIYQGSNKKVLVSSEFETEFNALNIQHGDTIRCSFSGSTGYVVDAAVVSQYGTNQDGETIAKITDPHGVTPKKINATQQKRWYFIGYVAERRGELIKIKHKGGGDYALTPDAAEMADETDMLYSHPTASTSVTVVDRAEGRIYTGSFDDIRDYTGHGDGASRVLVRYYSGQLKEIVVYND